MAKLDCLEKIVILVIITQCFACTQHVHQSTYKEESQCLFKKHDNQTLPWSTRARLLCIYPNDVSHVLREYINLVPRVFLRLQSPPILVDNKLIVLGPGGKIHFYFIDEFRTDYNS